MIFFRSRKMPKYFTLFTHLNRPFNFINEIVCSHFFFSNYSLFSQTHEIAARVDVIFVQNEAFSEKWRYICEFDVSEIEYFLSIAKGFFYSFSLYKSKDRKSKHILLNYTAVQKKWWWSKLSSCAIFTWAKRELGMAKLVSNFYFPKFFKNN